MSYGIPGYDAWKLASPPERYMPPNVEDLLDTTYVMHDEDGDVCLYGIANEYDANEWSEYDEDGHRVGGMDIRLQIAAFTPTGERTRTWDEFHTPEDVAEGCTDWTPIERSAIPFTFPKNIV